MQMRVFSEYMRHLVGAPQSIQKQAPPAVSAAADFLFFGSRETCQEVSHSIDRVQSISG